MNTAYLLLGTNLGERSKNLLNAISYLEQSVGTITKKSSVYETEPWGKREQNDFLNMAVEIQIEFSVKELLGNILSIEKLMGRERKEKWDERIIDIDILFFNDEVIAEENLTVPHPFLHQRKFTLVPLNEIASLFFHPVLKKTIQELLKQCKDDGEVDVTNADVQ